MKGLINEQTKINIEMKIHLNDLIKLNQMQPIQNVNPHSIKNRNSQISRFDIPLVKSEERASAIFSLLLLLEHRDHWNWKDDFMVDWTDRETKKGCITVINQQIDIINTYRSKILLSVGPNEPSLQFLESFNKLIYTAKGHL